MYTSFLFSLTWSGQFTVGRGYSGKIVLYEYKVTFRASSKSEAAAGIDECSTIKCTFFFTLQVEDWVSVDILGQRIPHGPRLCFLATSRSVWKLGLASNQLSPISACFYSQATVYPDKFIYIPAHWPVCAGYNLCLTVYDINLEKGR